MVTGFDTPVTGIVTGVDFARELVASVEYIVLVLDNGISELNICDEDNSRLDVRVEEIVSKLDVGVSSDSVGSSTRAVRMFGLVAGVEECDLPIENCVEENTSLLDMVSDIEGDIDVDNGSSLFVVVVNVSVTESDDSCFASRLGVRISKVVSPVYSDGVRVVYLSRSVVNAGGDVSASIIDSDRPPGSCVTVEVTTDDVAPCIVSPPLDSAVVDKSSRTLDDISGVVVADGFTVPSLFARYTVCLPVVSIDEAPLLLTDVAATSGPVEMTKTAAAEIWYTPNTVNAKLDSIIL